MIFIYSFLLTVTVVRIIVLFLIIPVCAEDIE